MKRFLCGLAVLGLLVSVAGQAGAQYAYSPIFAPGSFNTIASGINNTEQIVGFYVTNNIAHGFLLSGGGFTTIDVPGFLNTEAYGINSAGQIVGSYFTPQSMPNYHGFLLSAGTLTTIDRPGSSFTQLYAINNPGQIVGDSGNGGFL